MNESASRVSSDSARVLRNEDPQICFCIQAPQEYLVFQVHSELRVNMLCIFSWNIAL